MIDTVKNGTVLHLFQKQKLSNIWYYIYFRSEKRKASVTGFVKVTAVEPKDDVQNKLKEGKDKLKNKEKKTVIPSIPKKESFDSKKLKKEIPQIRKTPIESVARRKSKKMPEPSKISKKKSAMVTATTANIYRKPNIKSDIIDTVEKGTILTLAKSNESPNIWHQVSFFSKKTKSHRVGFVKFTSVEIISEDQKRLTSALSEKVPAPHMIRENLLNTVSPQLKAVFYQRLIEPPVEIKADQISPLSPTSRLEVMVFQKRARESVKLNKEKTELPAARPLSKDSVADLILKEEKKIFKEGKAPYSEAPAKDLEIIQSEEEDNNKLNKVRKNVEIKSEPAKTIPIQNLSVSNRVKVTAETANIYRKPNIKSDIIEKVEKGTILTLSRKQKSPKIWRHISLYSKETKAHLKGYVKSTAVEGVSYAQISPITASEKLKREEKDTITEIPRGEAISLTKTTGKIEREVFAIQKFYEEAEFETVPIKTREVQERFSKASNYAQDSFAEAIYDVKNRPQKEKNVPNKEEKSQITQSVTEETASARKINLTPQTTELGRKPFIADQQMEKISDSQELKDKSEDLKKEENPYMVSRTVKKDMPSEKLKEELDRLEKRPHKQTKMRPLPTKTRRFKKKFKLITLGMGYGQSYGGAGGLLQINTKTGLALHAGIGYFPASLVYSETDWVRGKILFSGGLKYYLPLKADPINLYLDLQYCGIGIEVADIFSGKFYNGPLFDSMQKTLWGPSFLGGIEVKMGLIGFNGALGLSYNISEADWLEKNIFLTFDVGLLIYF